MKAPASADAEARKLAFAYKTVDGGRMDVKVMRHFLDSEEGRFWQRNHGYVVNTGIPKALPLPASAASAEACKALM
jgi:hypothetical protein